MPIYEYECTHCGNVTEVLQKFSDAPLSECGNCTGKLHRIVSQSSFHLKGSGWYVTDYAAKNKNTTESKKSETAPESAPKAEKSSD